MANKPRAFDRHRLGDMLMLAGKVTQEQLDEAVEVQADQGTRLGSTLVGLGYISEDDLKRFLSTQQGVEANQGEEPGAALRAQAAVPGE